MRWAADSVTQYLDGQALETEYGYDELGNRIWQKDANGHLTALRVRQAGPRDGARPAGRQARDEEVLPDGS